ncbi:MAG TPA: hypothetical protein PLF40_11245, partial [Kofleriaceae bacterium]|nr:hypothetical protein [Kofleriaceae bacterium]
MSDRPSARPTKLPPMSMVTPAKPADPVAPAPSMTQPLGDGDLVTDDTSTVDAPLMTASADRVGYLLEEQFRSSQDPDVAVMSALVQWDCFDALDEVGPRLQRSTGHPATARTALAYALATGKPSDLAMASALINDVSDPFARSGLQIVAAESWWFRHHDAKAALAMDIGRGAAIAETLLVENRDRRALLAAAATRSTDAEATPESLADVLAELQDDNGSQAPHSEIIDIGLTALRSKRWLTDVASDADGQMPTNQQAPRWLHVAEIVLDSALVAGSPELLAEAFTVREQLLHVCRDGEPDALATGLLKAAAGVFCTVGQNAAASLASAAQSLSTLAKHKQASTHLNGANIARQLARVAAARTHQLDQLLIAH